jgi:putative transposase
MDLYHLLNRGVDKRTIFLDDQDRKRFVLGLEIFNDIQSVDNIHRNVGLTKSNKEELVEIHGWCLMRNHYHLLVSEKAENGITQFIRKLNIGYSKYFNEKYKRSGALFQGRTKKVRIETDPHFLHILNYIHLNPLDYHRDFRNWREGKISNATHATAYLDKYQWSSYHDYCQDVKFLNITFTLFFKEVFQNYPKQLKDYLTTLEIEEMKAYILE